MGSSPERIRIADLGDVVYYRQIKDYSDEDYETSKDLQRAVQKGSITVVEHTATPKSVGPGSKSVTAMTVNNAPVIDVETLKQAIREVLPAESKNTVSISNALREIVPSIVDMVRQEISGMSVRSPQEIRPQTEPGFEGPEYIPTVSAEGMISNIKVETKEVSGESVSSNLDLLRKLKSHE